MDACDARCIVTAVLVALATACSASSSSGARSSGGDGGHDAMDPESGGDDASEPPAYDAAVTMCASFPNSVERTACCEQQIPRGYSILQLAEQGCVCGPSGPCVGVCNFQDCASVEGSTSSCQSCLDISLAGSCRMTVASACAMDPGCVAYEACVRGS
jgi:hypothetical protein